MPAVAVGHASHDDHHGGGAMTRCRVCGHAPTCLVTTRRTKPHEQTVYRYRCHYHGPREWCGTVDAAAASWERWCRKRDPQHAANQDVASGRRRDW